MWDEDGADSTMRMLKGREESESERASERGSSSARGGAAGVCAARVVLRGVHASNGRAEFLRGLKMLVSGRQGAHGGAGEDKTFALGSNIPGFHPNF